MYVVIFLIWMMYFGLHAFAITKADDEDGPFFILTILFSMLFSSVFMIMLTQVILENQ